MRKTAFVLMALMLSFGLLAACGGGGGGSGQTGGTSSTGGGSAPAGNVAAGETLFAQATIGANPGCKTCHSLDGTQLVGPTMQGYATRAGTRVQGQSADEYTRLSMTDPNAHVVEGFAAGVMPTFKDVLNETQLNDLTAYLLSLK
jgi:mono/diheme cytochrome c family protein